MALSFQTICKSNEEKSDNLTRCLIKIKAGSRTYIDGIFANEYFPLSFLLCAKKMTVLCAKRPSWQISI